MKTSELRNLSVIELKEKLKTFKTELLTLVPQATNQLDNPMRIVEVKKTIARINTLLKEEERKAAN